MRPWLVIIVLWCAGTEAYPPGKQVLTRTELLDLGTAEYRAGHFAIAESYFVGALKTLDRNDDKQRAAILTNLGDVYLNRDELIKAEDAYSESLKIYSRISNNGGAAAVLRNLGAVYSLQRRDSEALKVLRQALKRAGFVSSTDHALIAQITNSQGLVYYRQGKYEMAETFFKKALAEVIEYAIPFDIAQLLNNLGMVYISKNDFQDAEAVLTKALRSEESAVGPSHSDLVFTLNALGLLFTKTRRYAEAERQYRRALTLLEPMKAESETRIARTLHSLGIMYTAAGRSAEAGDALIDAAAIARRNISHSDMVGIMDTYADWLKTQGKAKEAQELRAEAKRARIAARIVVHAYSRF